MITQEVTRTRLLSPLMSHLLISTKMHCDFHVFLFPSAPHPAPIGLFQLLATMSKLRPSGWSSAIPDFYCSTVVNQPPLFFFSCSVYFHCNFALNRNLKDVVCTSVDGGPARFLQRESTQITSNQTFHANISRLMSEGAGTGLAGGGSWTVAPLCAACSRGFLSWPVIATIGQGGMFVSHTTVPHYHPAAFICTAEAHISSRCVSNIYIYIYF